MSTLQTSLDTLADLIGFDSVSSTSNEAISDRIIEHLQSIGFGIEKTTYQDATGHRKVNLVACRDPSQHDDVQAEPGGLAYFCHTDVVPATHWSGPGGDPFQATVENDRMYGRGACDMKGSLVAMLAAAAKIDVNDQRTPLWIVCTSDEEVGFNGAKHLVKHSSAYREIVAAAPLCIIGEPTQMNVVYAHKGITGFGITSHGKAAHSSTDEGINANVAMVPMLQTLLDIDQLSRSDGRYFDGRFDPPHLSWNFGVSDGCTAVNVTPGVSTAWVSLRTMPEIDGEELIEVARRRAEELGLEFRRIKGGCPLFGNPKSADILQLCEMTRSKPRTVCYSTDGGEFTELERRVVLGPGDIRQAHTTDEWISFDQLRRGVEIYSEMIRHWCC